MNERWRWERKKILWWMWMRCQVCRRCVVVILRREARQERTTKHKWEIKEKRGDIWVCLTLQLRCIGKGYIIVINKGVIPVSFPLAGVYTNYTWERRRKATLFACWHLHIFLAHHHHQLHNKVMKRKKVKGESELCHTGHTSLRLHIKGSRWQKDWPQKKVVISLISERLLLLVVAAASS